MADAMQKDDTCEDCYYEERSYTVGPCNECSRAFSGTQRDWYLTNTPSEDREDWDTRDFCTTCTTDMRKCAACVVHPLVDNGVNYLPLYWSTGLTRTGNPKPPVSDSRIGNDSVKHPKHSDFVQYMPEKVIITVNDDLSNLQGIKVKVTSNDEEKYLTKLIDDHWAYIEGLMKAHDTDSDIIKAAKFHYKSAFRHGFKHALEYVKEKGDD